jgi:hypothetical protein
VRQESTSFDGEDEVVRGLSTPRFEHGAFWKLVEGVVDLHGGEAVGVKTAAVL